MPADSVQQEGNIAGGHIAGRDVVVLPAQPETPLKRLFQRMKDEASQDQVLCDYIRELEVFTRIVENEEVVGLDGKLKAADRSDQTDMALHMKEMVFSQLRQHVFSPTFQQIYAILMGKIFEEFETWAKPAIMNKLDRQTIDELVSTRVIKPVMLEVELCGDYHGISIQTIRGMLYFLTGNCHIRWH